MEHGQYRNMLLDLSSMIDDDDLTRIKFRCDNIIKKAESQKIKDPTHLFTALEQREHLGPQNLEFLKELLKTCCRGKVDGIRLIEQYERNNNPGGVVNTPVASGIPGSTNGGTASQQPQIVYVVQGDGGQNIPQNVLRDHNRQRYLGPELSVEIDFLCTKLGLDWRFLVRALGISEDDIDSISQDYPSVKEKALEKIVEIEEIAYLSAEIDFLCTKLGRDWRFLVRALGISEDDIDSVSQDYPSVKEKIRQFLWLWQLQEQQCANKQKLIDALRRKTVQRNDLAMNLEDGVYS